MVKQNAIAIVLDDHKLFADSFSALIDRLDFFQHIKTFNERKGVINYLLEQERLPIYLFLDYHLDGDNSLSLIHEVKLFYKRAYIIIISGTSNANVISNVLRYAPHGFISKSSGIDIVIDCIRHIEKDERFICPATEKLLNESKEISEIPFTPRELEILEDFAHGLSIEDTAKKRFLSKHTIVAHRRKMMSKIKAKSITELLAYARNVGII
jgi:DNA-binding NarL/FixJ family response regulator